MLLGHQWIKKCWVCKGRGHHLSQSQIRKLREDIRGKLSRNRHGTKRTVSRDEVDDKVWKHIKESKMLCEMCKGTNMITYPHN